MDSLIMACKYDPVQVVSRLLLYLQDSSPFAIFSEHLEVRRSESKLHISRIKGTNTFIFIYLFVIAAFGSVSCFFNDE